MVTVMEFLVEDRVVAPVHLVPAPTGAPSARRHASTSKSVEIKLLEFLAPFWCVVGSINKNFQKQNLRAGSLL